MTDAFGWSPRNVLELFDSDDLRRVSTSDRRWALTSVTTTLVRRYLMNWTAAHGREAQQRADVAAARVDEGYSAAMGDIGIRPSEREMDWMKLFGPRQVPGRDRQRGLA